MKKIIFVLFFLTILNENVFAQMTQETGLAEPGEKFQVHTVALGETVVLIAKSYRIRPQDIYEYNDGTAEGISQGMRLQIPLHRQVETVNFQNKENNNYDLLKKTPARSVALKEKETGNEITNSAAAGDAIAATPGPEAKTKDVTVINTEPVAAPDAPAEMADNAMAEQKGTITEAKKLTHKVVYGDNLYRLSLKYNTTIDAITQANKKLLRNGLQVGQVLNIPSEGKEPQNADVKKIVSIK
ncbi:LysM peptidoglycan-binding domain-containing protein [uncultured Flavobacterium sp.]|uniref:LysM peptidoglycan-binding domain-containing protein n=1 Tax=uncultured Flavobacterium sp. TaxID=165435 RepID=UPI0025E66660|nr:LysM peptidoglycan-binding domain-containing protein [uncultured Flavobacterium sp.]